MCRPCNVTNHTFADGSVIQMCSECSVHFTSIYEDLTSRDVKRSEVLRGGNSLLPIGVEPSDYQRWDIILDRAGFGMDAGSQRDYLDVTCDIKGTTDDPDAWYHGTGKRRAARVRTALDDHIWATSQTPFPHSESMPCALRNYCPYCTEIAGPRTTQGCYLPIDHECPRTRVYDLHGKLLEVI